MLGFYSISKKEFDFLMTTCKESNSNITPLIDKWEEGMRFFPFRWSIPVSCMDNETDFFSFDYYIRKGLLYGFVISQCPFKSGTPDNEYSKDTASLTSGGAEVSKKDLPFAFPLGSDSLYLSHTAPRDGISKKDFKYLVNHFNGQPNTVIKTTSFTPEKNGKMDAFIVKVGDYVYEIEGKTLGWHYWKYKDNWIGKSLGKTYNPNQSLDKIVKPTKDDTNKNMRSILPKCCKLDAPEPCLTKQLSNPV